MLVTAQWVRSLRRVFMRESLTREESFNVPVVINNRNRLVWLKALVDWLRNAGYRNIYILDNASTYPPLLEYYSSAPARVVYLGRNAGYMALWQSQLFSEIGRGYYVYSDPDVLPGERCPKDVVYRLYKVLQAYRSIEKCGVALRIDDLPDHYSRKAEVIGQIEGRYWQEPVAPDIYDAPVDTTFALYRPLAFGNAENCRAYRLAGDCTFRHMPWYENSAAPGEETTYYISHADTSTTWYRDGK